MKIDICNWKLIGAALASGTLLLASFVFAATTGQPIHITAGEKAKFTGSILSRSGDLIRIRDKKSGSVVAVDVTDSTKIERKEGRVLFFRHADMDVTAMVPGLTIEVEGVGNSTGQLEARKISFTPDEFAIQVAEERQIQANKATAQNAQSTADQAATSANQAQDAADQASQDAQAAGSLGVADAAAVAMVNKRVSDLDHYKVEAENDVYFETDSAVLKEEAKPALADLAKTAKSLKGYMIEISGYTAQRPNTKIDHQKLSEERAAAVAQYFYEVQSIPLRRILIPVGYGATHPLATNTDAEGRELNRRVDVKVLVNTGEGENL